MRRPVRVPSRGESGAPGAGLGAGGQVSHLDFTATCRAAVAPEVVGGAAWSPDGRYPPVRRYPATALTPVIS
jgi:hypothetical protein